MAIVTVITTPNTPDWPSSAPRRILHEAPDIEIQVERFVPIGSDAVPYFWAWGERIDQFEDVLRADPAVTNVQRLERVDTGALYSVEWTIDDPLIESLAEVDGALMEAYGTVTEWELTIWFERSEEASKFQQRCIDRGISFNVKRLQSVADIMNGEGSTITPPQREALMLAYDHGYFDQPRQITQTELAGELDLSPTAMGNRIRRGVANLIEEVLVQEYDHRSAKPSLDD